MSTFDLYAAYYDLLYRDKPYDQEVAYVVSLLPGGLSEGFRILELGCGTGGHAFRLAKRGCVVHGIDISKGMIDNARARMDGLPAAERERLRFDQADMRGYRSDSRQPFDLVLSLFHVMSYATSNADQQAAFECARAHLDVGGLFLFDFWYGPAVLSDRPRYTSKSVGDDVIDVARKTVPVMHVNENCVDVCFEVNVTAHIDARSQVFTERHRMRYLFLPEIARSLETNGFEMLSSQAWMSTAPLDDRTWYGCVAARAR